MATLTMKAMSMGMATMAMSVKGSDLNGTQKNGSAVIWFQSMKSGIPGVDWILVFGDARCLELEKHRHAVAAEAEEHALAEAQDAGVAPAQHEADGGEGVGQVFADEVEAEVVEQQRQHHQDHHRDQGEADELENAIVLECDRHMRCHLLTLRTNSPCGRNIRSPMTMSRVSTFDFSILHEKVGYALLCHKFCRMFR